MAIDLDALRQVRETAELIRDRDEIGVALDAMAAQLNERFRGRQALLLCVLNGGIVTTGHLTTRLEFMVEMGYLHVSRYRGATSGGALDWRAEPSVSTAGRDVILVDDIFDEGYTLAAIDRHCREAGAASVCSVVLVNKLHARKVKEFTPDVMGLEVADRYVFGFGMDYQEQFRNLPPCE